MIGGRRILAVVPARGGSKGLIRKNLRVLDGLPLVAHVGRVLQALPEVDRRVVSTDDDEIAKVAETSGVSAPFRRPAALSGDRIGDYEVLAHALECCEALDGVTYDVVLMLQPTSPLRTAQQVRACLDYLVEGSWDSVWTVSETDSKSHPMKQLLVREGVLSYYHPDGGAVIARQQLSPVYHRNGIAYAITRECLLDQGVIKGAKAGAMVTPGQAVSIDTEWDLELCELILRRGRRPE